MLVCLLVSIILAIFISPTVGRGVLPNKNHEKEFPPPTIVSVIGISYWLLCGTPKSFLKRTRCPPHSMWNRTETQSETFPKRTCDWRIRSASTSNHSQGLTTRTNGLSDQQELSKHLTFTSMSKKMPKFHCLLLPNTPSPHVTHGSESQSPGCLHATQIPGSNPFTLRKPPSGKKHLLVIEEPTQTWPLSLPLPVSKAHVSQHTLPRQPKWKKEVLQTQHPRTL